jgi:hemoglobin/transferrin/lactoferrin receptor protein
MLNCRAVGQQNSMAIFAQDEWRISRDLAATFGLRQNWIENKPTSQSAFPEREGITRESKMVGSVSLTYSGLKNIALRVIFFQGFKTPTPMQLLTGSGGLQPNLDLVPETSDNYELGLRYNGPNLDLDFSLYFNDLKEAILYVYNPALPGNQYQNIDEKKIVGAELAVNYRITDTGLAPYGSLNAMRVFSEREGFKTRYNDRPELTGKLGLKWEGEILSQEAFVDANAIMSSRSCLEEYNAASMGKTLRARRDDAWQTAKLSFCLEGKRDTFKYTASLSLNNFFNQDYVPVNSFLPDPGFHVVAMLGLEL